MNSVNDDHRPLIHLNHCGVSPLLGAATVAISRGADDFRNWRNALALGGNSRGRIHNAAANLLRVKKETIAFVPNSAHGLNVIAHGLRLKEGDEILSYRYEYPSNHYPWVVQQRRGVRLITFEGKSEEGRPHSFTIDDVREAITAQTRVLAISHVQFTSGFATSLSSLGELCRERGILFVVDAAQSIGAVPVRPDEVGIDALVTSGWKWLRGPVGSGIFYVSEKLQEQLDDIWVGPDMMVQDEDYLNHSWQPYPDARRFEFSTAPLFSSLGLAAALEAHLQAGGDEVVWKRLQERQEHLIAGLAPLGLDPISLSVGDRAGILSFPLKNISPDTLSAALNKRRIVCSSRGGYLRFAPHHDTSEALLDEAIIQVGEVLEELS
jgi:selenocysteine lyase/cysteine desulfurase